MAEGSSNFQLHADQGPLIVTVSIAMTCVAGVSVCLRFFSRRVTHVPLMADDWFILASVPFAFAASAIAIWGVIHHGLGTHVLATGSVDSLHGFLQGLYVFEIAYCTSVSISKFSIIALYWRIFAESKLKIPLRITAAATLAWVVAVDLVAIFSCDPVEAFWIFEMPAHCINSLQYFVWSASGNILIDAVLLVLPLIMVSRLHITLIQKFAVSAVFGLGVFVTLCSCLRLNQLVIATQHGMSTDPTWDLSGSAIWSVIEACASILCACLPSMRPLARWVIHGKLPRYDQGSRSHIGGSFSYRPRSLATIRSNSDSTESSKKPLKLIKSFSSHSNKSWSEAEAPAIEKPALAWTNSNPFKKASHVEEHEMCAPTMSVLNPAATRGWHRRPSCAIARGLQDLAHKGSTGGVSTRSSNEIMRKGEVWVHHEVRVEHSEAGDGQHLPRSIAKFDTKRKRSAGGTPLVRSRRPSEDRTAMYVGSERVMGPYGEVRWHKREDQDEEMEMGLGVVDDDAWFEDLKEMSPHVPKPRPISSMESLTLGNPQLLQKHRFQS